ncbi:protein-l-isoaspartate o-methyltransferase domain-containing protein 2 [Plakobranchus ocellatus]|uniref:Protein-l-isoaspartate o-methyltransferase domain-containing protein 2 n=1 Tax=Plakobranchus ocellatus TaxID=259542 RepID=A0AAV4DBE4_9GAST|nr:protein-l-isoaspartate o-methyltransferase domain-containing protein 2 [Plakobranchus ocellatus]
MGGAYSVGQDNDDLIDKLKEKDYIRSDKVERVFRMVDRAHYYLEENRETAYEDIAWRNGLLHMSAPCIYSKVMEALELEKGMSFLNLGSGTGYLNTLVGYAIGPYGINHGIELHADNVSYAKKRLEEFIQTAPRFDDLELCEPKFVVGNCLNLSVENRLYDRVYCGAACPPEQKEVLQNMVKVGGILITPVGDQLLKIKRMTATEFSSENILPVSFASLIVPSAKEIPDDTILMPDVDPLSLQSISRIVIRNAIRSTFEFNLPVARAARSRRKGKRTETNCSSLYPGLGSFNFVPTQDGIMVLRFGGQRDQRQSHVISSAHDDDLQESGAAAATDSDSSTADDNIEVEEEDDDEDGNLLDHQLHIHAQTLRRMKERSEARSLLDRDVDSDLSDNDDYQKFDSYPSKDVNGNSSRNFSLSSTSNSRDDQAELLSKKTQQGKTSLSTPRKKKKMSVMPKPVFEASSVKPSMTKGKNVDQHGNSSPEMDETCFTEREEGHNLPELDEKLDRSSPCQERAEEKIKKHSIKRRLGHKPKWEPISSSLSSDDDATIPSEIQSPIETDDAFDSSKSSPSMVIEVPSSNTPSQPCTIQKQVSYSTSADTSETSGFGSLGDDTALLSESLKEGPSSLSSDLFLPESNGRHKQSSNDRNKESVDEGIGNLPDVDWMDIEEEQHNEVNEDTAAGSDKDNIPGDDDEERPGISKLLTEEGDGDGVENSSENFDSDSDINMRHVLAQFSRLVKRRQSTTSSKDSDDSNESDEGDRASAGDEEANKAPDFSSFLKEKVDTLPIPNSIKAFILHYR